MITYVSFYTDDEIYTKHAKRLIESLELHQLKYDIHKIDKDRHWINTVNLKPQFCKRMLLKHESNIVWIDSDAVVVKYPYLFETLTDIDVAVCYRERPQRPHELLTGTLFLSYNSRVMTLLDTWEKLCNTEYVVDQVLFDKAMSEHRNNITEFILPYGYTKIFDANDMNDGEPFIVHYQASREAKRKERLERFHNR